MYCAHCGVKNPIDSNFCKQCGNRIDKNAKPKISEDDYIRALPEEERVNALLERAYQLRATNDLTGAAEHCEEALRLRPENAPAHSLLGQIYAQQGERERALKELESAIQLNPSSIADRLKRDEIRAEPNPVFVPPSAPLPPPVPARHPVTIAFGALALFLAGGALALKFWPQQKTETPQTQIASGTPIASNPSPPTTSSPGSSVTPMGSPSLPPPSSTQSGQGGSQTPSMMSGTPTPGVPTGNQSPLSMGAVTKAVNTRQSGGERRSAPTQEEPDGSKRAPLEEDTVTQEDGKIRIVIGNKEINSGKTGKNTKPNNDGKIKITQQPINPTETGDAPSGDAGTFIGMGDDFRQKSDFRRAISAYQKGLPEANGLRAYVYQHIGSCFLQINDKQSARTNLLKGKEEYQKMLDAGKQTEKARDGIRACERSLKLCE